MKLQDEVLELEVLEVEVEEGEVLEGEVVEGEVEDGGVGGINISLSDRSFFTTFVATLSFSQIDLFDSSLLKHLSDIKL
jgi:hypothetical protein